MNLLVFGGSQGAHAINMAMCDAAPSLAAGRSSMQLVHQTGERDLDTRARRVSTAPASAPRSSRSCTTWAAACNAADLVVCRAGATTLAEIAAAGKASILIPLPTATDDHQRKNAETLGSAGAAEVILQGDATGHELATRILALAADRDRRDRMARAARALARPDAARVIVDRALTLVT